MKTDPPYEFLTVGELRDRYIADVLRRTARRIGSVIRLMVSAEVWIVGLAALGGIIAMLAVFRLVGGDWALLILGVLLIVLSALLRIGVARG